ncbi:MAG TPA: zf-HC2 domain-containing protein [Candidatus Baltobacteraceae bacterium]
MRCSFFELQLDEFVDGTLPSARMTVVAAHVENCAHCSGLLEELRVIDALLVTPSIAEPLPNMTFRIMAEVRSLPVHRARHTTALSVMASYLVFAWAALFAWFWWGGPTSRASVAFLRETALQYTDGAGSLMRATAHLFGHQTSGVTAAMLGLLSLDLVAACSVVVGYFFVLPRLAARLAPLPEVLS